jgi:hypothetical protein
MNAFYKTALTLLITAASTANYAQSPASPARLDEVAERGSHVMPFHLDKTLHVFNKTEHGGIQQVITKNAGDNEQITLIRRHLSDLSERFKQGDFSQQRRIHGDSMPGVSELAGAYRNVNFAYRELPNGAEIEFTANEPALIDAIHRYFDAQLSDHARHAVHHHHGSSAMPNPAIK